MADPVALIEHTLGWAPDRYRLRSIKRGLTNTVYALRHIDGTRLALRLNHPDSAALGIDRASELRVHRAAALNGLAPAIIAANETWLLTEWHRGRPWQPSHFCDPRRLKPLCERLHALWSLDVQAPERPIAALIPSAPALDLGPTVLCHGDLSSANLIGAPKPTFIDFEFTARAPALWDLAQLCASNQLDPNAQRTTLDAFGWRKRQIELTALIQAARQMNQSWLAALS
jgi:aminoglycoside phosphotransferase (APT) family kinase protein